MLLARLLLLLEYLIKNLYDAPVTMLQHSRRRRWSGASDSYISLLSNLETNSQDLPKLDGLACSFLLAPSDTFRYSNLYESILNILHVIHQCEFHSMHKDKRDYSALCAVQYCFSAAWSLVQCLPPSVSVMENLSTPAIEADQAALLHLLLWGPRAAHKVYNAWVTDCLVKQGLTTQKAIFVVKAAAKHANGSTFLLQIAKQLAQVMKQSSRLKDISVVPDLLDALVMDIVVARLRLLHDECATW